jgi:hypothetical protein
LRLSIPRFAKAAAAISLVSVPLVAFAAPAFADQPPNARPAMNGAQPRSRPVTPPTPNNMTILMHQLGGDAMFSVATLAVLLVPITGYGVLIRQRERREESEAAERSEREAAASGTARPAARVLRPAPAQARGAAERSRAVRTASIPAEAGADRPVDVVDAAVGPVRVHALAAAERSERAVEPGAADPRVISR